MMSLFKERNYFGKIYPCHPFIYFVGGFIKIGDGIICVVTLGLINASWVPRFYRWIIKRRGEKV